MTSRDKHVIGDGQMMQPHYLGELSKTSRTLANEEDQVMSSPTKQAINAVIRRPQKIHRRNKIRKIPYYLKKHRLGQRVS